MAWRSRGIVLGALAMLLGACMLLGVDADDYEPAGKGTTSGGGVGVGGTIAMGGGGQVTTTTDPSAGGGAGAKASGGGGGNSTGGSGAAPNGTMCDIGVDCQSGHCIDSVCCESICDQACEVCNNAGSCVAEAATASCGDYHCDGTNHTCPTSCVQDSDCNGFPCRGARCCSGPCPMPCRSCNVLHTGDPDGTCGFVTQGLDPFLECTPETCSGFGSCTVGGIGGML